MDNFTKYYCFKCDKYTVFLDGKCQNCLKRHKKIKRDFFFYKDKKDNKIKRVI